LVENFSIAPKAKGENVKKEIVKGLAMVTLVIAIALATAVVSANGQSNRRIVADIPFEFVVGAQAMSAGEYRIGSASALSQGVRVQTADAKKSAMRLTNALEPQKNKTHARLVFHQYGRQYFLAEVWTGGSDSGQQLIKSRQERAIERELATIASNSKSAPGSYAFVEVVAAIR
jgi:hypothetical protein